MSTRVLCWSSTIVELAGEMNSGYERETDQFRNSTTCRFPFTCSTVGDVVVVAAAVVDDDLGTEERWTRKSWDHPSMKWSPKSHHQFSHDHHVSSLLSTADKVIVFTFSCIIA